MIKITINKRIIVIDPRHITFVETENREIIIGIYNNSNIHILMSELPDAIVEVVDSNDWVKTIDFLIKKNFTNF